MADPFTALILRESGAWNSGSGRRRRTRGPRRRKPFVAHPAAWWDADVTASHLEGCRTGRDASGEWKSWPDMTEHERWSWYWELMVESGTVIGGGPAVPTEVP